MNLHLKDLINVQNSEEKEFLKLIETEQEETRKLIKTVEATKKIDISFLENGIYLLNVDGNIIKFIKK